MYRRRRSASYKFDKAHEMRLNPTPAEARMWEILKNQVMPTFPNNIFYRQTVLYGYILDFYCPTLRLGVEIDGSIHDDQRKYDRQRDSNLRRWGIKVLRYRNEDVFNNPEILASQLCNIIENKITPWYKKLYRFIESAIFSKNK
jgi:very-short-patch-repair endonuclease